MTCTHRNVTSPKSNNKYAYKNRHTFILLNAGVGRRSKYHGHKCLFTVNNKTVIDSQIDVIKRTYGSSAEIIVVSGYKSEKLIKELTGVRIVENLNYEKFHLSESIRVGINASLKSNVYLVHGDILFSSSFISPPDQNNIYVPVENQGKFEKDSVGVITVGKNIKNFSYGLTTKWCQIVCIPAEIFDVFRKTINTLDKNLSSFEVLNAIIKRGEPIKFFESTKGKIKEINSIRDTQ